VTADTCSSVALVVQLSRFYYTTPRSGTAPLCPCRALHPPHSASGPTHCAGAQALSCPGTPAPLVSIVLIHTCPNIQCVRGPAPISIRSARGKSGSGCVRACVRVCVRACVRACVRRSCSSVTAAPVRGTTPPPTDPSFAPTLSLDHLSSPRYPKKTATL